MNDINFGQSHKRQVTIRLFRQHWKHFRLPWYVWHSNTNHRCYCNIGTLFDFGAAFFGFGFIVFYSNFGGEVPCVCDKVIREMFPDEYGDDE